MSKNARARGARRRLIAGVALTTVVSAGSATVAAADSGTPTAPATPGGPLAPITGPWTGPIMTPTAPPPSAPKPTPSPSPSPTKPAPSHPKAGAGRFDNALIAETALGYVGRWGGQACLDAHAYADGQCREFVDCVVWLATGGKIWPVDPGGNYQVGFSAAGAVPVAAQDAAEGDIIQIGDHDDSLPLHTAIVLANLGGGSFTVVDSNWVGWPTTPELVGVHDWTPPDGARIWRLGAVTAQAGSAAGHKTASTGSAKGALGAFGSLNQNSSSGLLLAPPAAPNLRTDTVDGLASGVITVHATDADPVHGSARMRFWIDGRPADSADTVAGSTSVQLDTTKLSDGQHLISVQAVTANGAISVLSDPAPIAVTNHQLTVAVAAPTTPLLTGTVPLAVGAAPAADLATTTLTVDGVPAPSQPATANGTLNLDTTTLTAGPHAVSVTVTDHEGRTVTWGPVTVTVTGAATGLRAVLPSAATGPGSTGPTAAGHGDLVAIDGTGRLVRYPWRADATFGTPQPLAAGFGDVTALVAGHFTGPADAPQLLAVRKDGSGHLYGFDASGKFVDQGTITGPAWGTYTRLAAGRFTSDGRHELVGIDKDGHAQLISVGDATPADPGKTPTVTAKVEGLSVDPALGAAPAMLAEPAAAATGATRATGATTPAGQAGATGATGGGVDRLVAVDAAGTVSTFVFDAKRGFVPIDPAAAKNTPAPQQPAPATTPVLGSFAGPGPEVLITGADGQTWVLSATHPDQPSQGAVFNVPDPAANLTAPPAPPAPTAQGQRRLTEVTY